MKNKYLLLIITLLFLAGFFYYRGVKTVNLEATQTDNQVVEAKVDLVIDFGNDDVRSFNLISNAEDTAFSILKITAEKENISLQFKQYDFGVFVEKIDEFESTAKKSWIYYVNSESGQIAADQMKLKNGDKVEWKYETPK